MNGRLLLGILGAAIGMLFAIALPGRFPAPIAAATGGISRTQVARGQLVYVQQCLICHGAHLEGITGPPLAGPAFGRSLANGRMTTHTLFHFISDSMPMGAPGSLTHAQYLDVLAYILSKSGYSTGNAPLSDGTLAKLELLPFPNLSPEPQSRISPEPAVTGSVPAAVDVALDDGRLRDAGTDANDWRLPGRTYDNERYSALHQIDTTNVRSLMPVTIVHTGYFSGFEATPIVVGGIMYVTTPVVAGHIKIMALDATSGKVIWTRAYAIGSFKVCCGTNNRGAAVAYGNIYFATLDDRLIALDARTGSERWQATVADPAQGYSESMAPQVYDGEVIVGSAGGEWPLRGFVAAYDARTGKQRWRWFTTDPKTFGGDSWKRGGGTVWTTPAIDPRLGLVIFGTGNPNPDLEGSERPGDNLYTDSIVALDARSGKLRWYYQEVKHDLWDYDATSNVVLFDVHPNGAVIPAAGQAGKVGWFFIVDRRNGHLLRKSQPFVTQNKDMFTKRAVLPGANGGSEWSPPAYSPPLHLVYVLGMNQLMDFQTQRPDTHPGFMRTGSVFTNVKAPKIQNGTFTAIDVESGKIRWQYEAQRPMIGGALATAGNLVFVGEGDGSFDALDARNGQRLWTYRFAGGANAPAVTYAVNGTQYVAVAAGGNYQLNYPRGDAIGIFRLKP